MEKISCIGDRGICRGGSSLGPSRKVYSMINCIDPLHWGGILQQQDHRITVKLGDECV